MTIIAALKVTNANRPHQQPVIIQRRNNLINALHDQLELARAEAEGREYLKSRRLHLMNPVTGNMPKPWSAAVLALGSGPQMMVRFISICDTATELLK